MMAKPLGIVVVGLGRAGRARVRDITTNVLGENVAKLIGVVSRHKPEDVKETFLSLDEALGRSDVDAFIIATENGNHEECAKKCLDAGKHILVEFPLTISSQSAKDIIEIAEKKGVVCQEEDIGLLTPSFKELIQMLESKPPVTETKMVFTASKISSWIGDLKQAGFPSFSGISRLHKLYEMFGELTVKEAKLTRDENSIEMVATLLTKENRPIIWISSRSPGKDRSLSFDFKFEDGTTTSYSPRMGPPARGAAPPPTEGPPRGPPKGLFAQDLKLFIAKVLGEVGAEELAKERKRTLHCLELAGKIEEMAAGGK